MVGQNSQRWSFGIENENHSSTTIPDIWLRSASLEIYLVEDKKILSFLSLSITSILLPFGYQTSTAACPNESKIKSNFLLSTMTCWVDAFKAWDYLNAYIDINYKFCYLKFLIIIFFKCILNLFYFMDFNHILFYDYFILSISILFRPKLISL